MLLKKSLTFGIIFLFIGMSIIPSTGINVLEQSTVSTLDGNTLYVGGSGEGNYTKIQYAIDNASDGDTVFVYSGTYYENVLVNKSIDLIGEDKNITVIDGGGTAYEYVIYISAEGVNVNGFTIQNRSGWPEKGIRIFRASNISISRNIFIDNFFGIADSYSFKNTLLENIFINNTVGIHSGYSSDIIIKGNIITNHTFGINLQDTSNVFIEGNRIFLPEKPELFNNTWGICQRYSSNNTIEENTIINHTWGIQCVDSSHHIISKNTLINNYEGIYLHNASNYEINGNVMINNYHIGIWLRNPSNYNKISRNIIANSSEYGIYLESSFFNIIKENNFIDNNRNAFFEGSLFNRWIKNYWERPRLLPYPIFGEIKIGPILIPWVSFDWRPAKEPYDIGVLNE